MSGAVDAHVHLDHPDLRDDLPGVLQRARAAGVDGYVIPTGDPTTWVEVAAFGRAFGAVVGAGVHPWDAGRSWAGAAIVALRDVPTSFIGEIGLDAIRASDDVSRRAQRRCFRDQLAIARERGLPVVLHGVRAWPEVADVLRRDGAPVGGMAHGWTGPPEVASRLIALGMHVSFGPAILRDRAVHARRAASIVPPERLLVETDGPSMAPPRIPRGEPAHLVAVIAEVAALRGVPPGQVLDVTAANARALFGWARPSAS